MIHLSVKAQPPVFKNQDSLVQYLKDLQSTPQAGRSTEVYFAALYLQTTVFIEQMCEQKKFSDPTFIREMMLDFGNRFSYAVYYKDSVHLLPLPWKEAFHGKRKPLTESQKLSLAINAHINHDLPESLFALHPQGDIRHLHRDFSKIDQVFDSIGQSIYWRVIKSDPWRDDEKKILHKSMTWSMKYGAISRKKVFKLARKYAHGNAAKKVRIHRRKNLRAARISGQLAHPHGRLKKSFMLLDSRESKNPAENLNKWFGL